MRVLCTGGAGYVGGHCHRAFLAQGCESWVFDDLSEGNREAASPDRLVIGDIRDTEAVARALRELRIDAVAHFAALVSVPEALKEPQGYWSINVEGARSVLDAMAATGVRRLVLSSTAAVYAHDVAMPISEDARLDPATPYGATKLAMEMMARDYAARFGFAATALRYFNACGAETGGAHGEARRAESHVVPLLMESALGRRGPFKVFGDDWPTRDGSCIRDFVSVQDLAQAHRLALLNAAPGALAVYNLGTGSGTSVLELLQAAQQVIGRPIPHERAPRRPGDPPVLVADSARIGAAMGWSPAHSSIETILRDAWAWHSAHPHGYGARDSAAAAAR